MKLGEIEKLSILNQSVFRLSILALCAAFSLTACSNQVGSNLFPTIESTNDESELTQSEEAFSLSVFPVINERCSNCHTSLQAPFFAIRDDVVGSHQNTLDARLLDCDDVRGARLIEKVRLGHNCWTDDCQADGDELFEAADQWCAERGEEDELEGQLTAEVTIPASLGSEIQTLEFDISDLGSDIPAGATFEIDIRVFDLFSYELSNPVIKSSARQQVQGLEVFINGRNASEGSAFSFIDVVSEIDTDPGYQVSSSSILVDIGLGNPLNGDLPTGGPGEDTIFLRFGNIGAPATPRQLAFIAFKEEFNANCSACHGGSTGAVPFGFTGLSTESEFFDRLLTRTNNDGSSRLLVVRGDPDSSALYQSVAHGLDGQSYPEISSDLSRYLMPQGMTDEGSRRPIMEAMKAWIELTAE